MVPDNTAPIVSPSPRTLCVLGKSEKSVLSNDVYETGEFPRGLITKLEIGMELQCFFSNGNEHAMKLKKFDYSFYPEEMITFDLF